MLQTKQGGWRCAAEAAPGKEVPALGSSRRAWLGQARPRQTSVWQPQGLQRWTASRRAAAPLGKMSRSKRGGGKNPRGASGERNPLSLTSPGFGCCKWGTDAAVQQPGPQQRGLQPSSPTKPCSHVSWFQPLPLTSGPCYPPPGTAHKGRQRSLKPGHLLQEPLPLDAFCRCIAPWSLHTLLTHTHATPSFQTPHCHPTSHPCRDGAGCSPLPGAKSIPLRCRGTLD